MVNLVLLAACHEEWAGDGSKYSDDEINDSFPIDLFHFFFSGFLGVDNPGEENTQAPVHDYETVGLVGAKYVAPSFLSSECSCRIPSPGYLTISS